MPHNQQVDCELELCPGINLISECSSSKWIEGRGAFNQPIAIVFHQFEGSIEELDALHRSPDFTPGENGCHESFGAGISIDGFIHYYVCPENQSLTFPDDWETSQDCGVCDWPVAAGNPGVNPNTYTYNIAIVRSNITQRDTVFCQEGEYPREQLDAMCRLICCLGEQFDIQVTYPFVWRHCNELDDIDLDVYTECVLDCASCTDDLNPCQYLCNQYDDCLPCDDNGGPTEGPVDLDMFEGGTDEETQEVGDVDLTIENAGIPFGPGVEFTISGVSATDLITLTFSEPQENLSLYFDDFDNSTDEVLDSFSVAPDSVTGDLDLTGGVVTSTIDGGAGTVVFAGPLTEVSFRYATDPLAAALNTLLMPRIMSDDIRTVFGAFAEPGVTQIFDPVSCCIRTFPPSTDFDLCSALAILNEGGNVEQGSRLLTPDCNYLTIDVCLLLQSLPQAAELETFYMIGLDDQAACSLLPVPLVCDPQGLNIAALGVNEVGEFGLRPLKQTLNIREAFNGESLVPATDRIVKLDATDGSLIFTLTPPQNCEPCDFWVIRMDCEQANSVTINGGVSTIAGNIAVTLETPCPIGPGQGETFHLYFDASENNWILL